jgi:hypothetical protein
MGIGGGPHCHIDATGDAAGIGTCSTSYVSRAPGSAGALGPEAGTSVCASGTDELRSRRSSKGERHHHQDGNQPQMNAGNRFPQFHRIHSHCTFSIRVVKTNPGTPIRVSCPMERSLYEHWGSCSSPHIHAGNFA